MHYKFAPRVVGAIAVCYADSVHAIKLIGSHAKRDIATTRVDHWRWRQKKRLISIHERTKVSE